MKATVTASSSRDGGKTIMTQEVTGEVVGPFVVHRMAGSGMRLASGAKWGITHAATGFNAAHGPTKGCCMHAARRMRDVGCDWSFTSPEAVKSFAREHREAIHVIRAACAMGGEA